MPDKYKSIGIGVDVSSPCRFGGQLMKPGGRLRLVDTALCIGHAHATILRLHEPAAVAHNLDRLKIIPG
jgi:hypothetical protein